MPLELKLAEDLLDLQQDMLDLVRFAGHLKIINMFGHECGQATFVMPHAKLVVDEARLKLALGSGLAELHREGSGCITKTGAWLITVQHFGLWIKIFEPIYHSQQGNVARRQVKNHLSEGFAGHLRELLVCNSL